LPLTVEEFQIGQLYAVTKMSVDGSGGSDGAGVKVITNEAYDYRTRAKDVPGGGTAGQYTQKVYALGSKLPSWLSSMVSEEMGHVEERAWNAYPYCLTQLGSAWLGDSFGITIESRHVMDDGSNDNVFGLQGEELRNRKIKVIDIAEPGGAGEVDARTWQPRNASQRGPLKEGWHHGPQVRMCAYKLLRVHFTWAWAISGAVEKLVVSTERTLFRDLHLNAYLTMDEWAGLDLASVRALEEQSNKQLARAAGRRGGTQQKFGASFSTSFTGCTSPVVSRQSSVDRVAMGLVSPRSRSGSEEAGHHLEKSAQWREDLEKSALWRRSLSSADELERSALWHSCLSLPADGTAGAGGSLAGSMLGRSSTQADIVAAAITAAWAGASETSQLPRDIHWLRWKLRFSRCCRGGCGVWGRGPLASWPRRE